MARLAPRPWLMIHGERDTYIGPEIAQRPVRSRQGPKELWLVPEAKHNRCRETDPDAYAAQAPGFSRTIRPRRPLAAPTEVVSRHGAAAERLRSSAGRRRR